MPIDAAVALLIKEYTENELSTHQIAEKYSMTQSYVYNLLYKYGVQFRKANERKPQRTAAALELYKQGLAVKKIREQTGISYETLYRAIRKHNIPKRSLT